jgi:hypothetical protein
MMDWFSQLVERLRLLLSQAGTRRSRIILSAEPVLVWCTGPTASSFAGQDSESSSNVLFRASGGSFDRMAAGQ